MPRWRGPDRRRSGPTDIQILNENKCVSLNSVGVLLRCRNTDEIIHHRHHDAEPAMRGTAQSDASDPAASDMAGAVGGGTGEPDALKSLLSPYAGAMTAWPVSTRVGNVKNNDASLIEPVG
jgi:hypothetical protein